MTSRVDTLVETGEKALYLKDVTDTLFNNSPDGTDDGFDDFINKASLGVSTFDLMGKFSKKSFNDPNLTARQAFGKSAVLQANVGLVYASSINAIKHFDNGRYDKGISNTFVAISGSFGVLSQFVDSIPVDKIPVFGRVTNKAMNKVEMGLSAAAFGWSIAAQLAGEGENIAGFLYDRYVAAAKKLNEIQGKIQQFTKDMSDKIDNAKEMAQEIYQEFTKEIENYANEVAKVTEGIANSMPKEFVDAYNKAVDWFNGVAEGVPHKYFENWNEAEKWFENLPDDFKDPFKDYFREMMEDWSEKFRDWLPDSFAQWFDIPNRTGQHYFYDPLVLDLDGDGIETTAVHAQYSKNAFFDFDGDGSYHATGWVKKDDGILVRDINGDGIINNGTELFGDSTLKMDGTRARHGFDALSDLDSNRDGMINARDDVFDSLLVWQDANTNGISEASELRTLSELGITKLNLAHTDTNQNLYNKNTLTHLGSYTKADGTVHKMGDVNFAFSRVHAQLTQPVEMPDEIRQLANLIGRGRVADLHHAMMTSVALTTIVKDYMSTTTKTEQMAKLDGLLQAWAQTDSQYQAYGHDIGVSQVARTGVGTAVAGSTDSIDPTKHEAALAEFNTIKHKIGVLDSLLGSKTDQLYYAGTRTLIQTNKIINDSYDKLISHTYAALYPQTDNYLELYQMVDVSLALVGTKMQLQMDFDRLAQHIADKLPLSDEQHFVKVVEFLAYLSSTPHYQSASIVHMDKILQQVQDVTADLPKQIMQTWVQGVNESILSKSKLTLGTEVVDTGRDVNLAFGNHGNDRLHGTQGDDVLLGGTGNDHLEGGTGNDTLIGGTGDDRLYGGYGADTYVFNKGHGRDVIADSEYTHAPQQAPMDKIVFNDILSKDITASLGSTYNLTLHSSENDSVMIQSHNANEASQIEQIEFTDKTLSMKDYLSQLTASIDSTSGNDRIEANYWLGSVDGQLGGGGDLFRINANAKSVKIDGGAGDDHITTGNANDTLIGGAGNDRLYAQAGDDFLDGGNGNDTLNGGDGDDALHGGVGEDILESNLGNDSLDGGNDNDTLRAGADNDILRGGAGDDFLDGSTGADTYVFNKGHGRDVIIDTDYTPRQQAPTDKLVFNDILSKDITASLMNTHDVVLHTSESDSITMRNHNYSEYFHIEQIEFADQALSMQDYLSQLTATIDSTDGKDNIYAHHWLGGVDSHLGDGDDLFHATANIKSVKINGGAGNDYIIAGDADDILIGGEGNDGLHAGKGNDELYGGIGNDTLDGGAGHDVLDGGDGDDRLSAGAGDDVLIGGVGRDHLQGGQGLDVYVFNKGHGQDTIDNYDHDYRVSDTIRLSDVLFDDVTIDRLGNDLVLSGYHRDDSITVKSFYSSQAFGVEQFEFGDRTVSYQEILSHQVV